MRLAWKFSECIQKRDCGARLFRIFLEVRGEMSPVTNLFEISHDQGSCLIVDKNLDLAKKMNDEDEIMR